MQETINSLNMMRRCGHGARHGARRMIGDSPASIAEAHHPSPPLALLAAVHAVLFVASAAAAPRWSAFLQVGAAIPLGLFAATASSRLHFLGVRAAGATIALFGGVAASLLLTVGALASWALSSTAAASEPVASALGAFASATGGPAQVMALGLLVAGVAVTAGLARLAPRWLMPAGLAIAVVAELSWLALAFPAARFLVPAARFPALAWLVAAGALLPSRARAGG
jgi:hypothetical protein